MAEKSTKLQNKEDQFPEAEAALLASVVTWEQIQDLTVDERRGAVRDAFMKYDVAQLRNFSRVGQAKIWGAIKFLWRSAQIYDPDLEISKQLVVQPIAIWEEVQDLAFEEKMRAIDDGFKSH